MRPSADIDGNVTPSSLPSASPTRVTRETSPLATFMAYTSKVPSGSLTKYTVSPSGPHIGSIEATFWKRSRSLSRRFIAGGSPVRSACHSCAAWGPW